MINELDRMAFCIWRIIDSHLSPTHELFNIFLNLFRTAPKDIHDDVILIDLIFRISVHNSSLSLLYFVVFSKSVLLHYYYYYYYKWYR